MSLGILDLLVYFQRGRFKALLSFITYFLSPLSVFLEKFLNAAQDVSF